MPRYIGSMAAAQLQRQVLAAALASVLAAASASALAAHVGCILAPVPGYNVSFSNGNNSNCIISFVAGCSVGFSTGNTCRLYHRLRFD